MEDKQEITYEDFAKLDLRVATIKEVEPGASGLVHVIYESGSADSVVKSSFDQRFSA